MVSNSKIQPVIAKGAKESVLKALQVPGLTETGRGIPSELTSVEVASVDALFEVEDALVVLHQAAQFLRQLQSHVLQRCRLCAVHHHRLCGLVE